MRVVTLWFFLLAVLLTGCRRGDPPVPQPGSADDLKAHGVRYDLPLKGSDTDRATEFLRAVRPDGISWSGEGHTLEIAGGRVKVDGKAHGTVNQGDTVRLAPDGQLFVNGERREPRGN
jgi:hypothetical protein